MRKILIATTALVLAAAPLAAEAASRTQRAPERAEASQSGVRTGTLECDVAGSVGMIIGSSRKVSCTYQGAGRSQRYVGTINRIGLDVGVMKDAKMVWSVVAPSGEAARMGLEGKYRGASVGAAAVYGGAANVLVGGSSGFNLQPVTVNSERGVNLAAGVSSLSLAPAAPSGRG